MGRSRASMGPGSGSARAAGTVAENTEAGSPKRARGTVEARWSRVMRATPSPAVTGASRGSRRRHVGP